MSETIEGGDIYFFYRPRVEVEQPRRLDDIQRFYLVLLPDRDGPARLFVVGKKRLPEAGGKRHEREWMMLDLTGSPAQIGETLRPVAYHTETRGEREQGEAIPVGEGRYALYQRHHSTRLGYRLTQPDKPRRAQQVFNIQDEASYVISIRNPAVKVPGFPDVEPDYPGHLAKRFGDRRWIDVETPRLLDYEKAQVIVIGAHDTLQPEARISGHPDLFGRLRLERCEWPTDALRRGRMAKAEREPPARAPNQ